MNSTTISTKKGIREAYASLTAEEIQALEQRIDGYGWLADSARRAGVHTNTIRNIIRRGYGTAEAVNRIRIRLLS